jgi:hypothetical protein
MNIENSEEQRETTENSEARRCFSTPRRPRPKDFCSGEQIRRYKFLAGGTAKTATKASKSLHAEAMLGVREAARPHIGSIFRGGRRESARSARTRPRWSMPADLH